MLELIALLGGGLVRLLPEAFAFLNKWQDNAHEYKMMTLQKELQQMKGDQEIAHTELTGNFDVALAQMTLHADALRGQMQKTGNKWIDRMNFALRPIVTYYFLLMYGTFKCALLVAALNGDVSFWTAVLEVYDDQDRGALWGILGFWFVGRVHEKMGGQYRAPGNGQF